MPDIIIKERDWNTIGILMDKINRLAAAIDMLRVYFENDKTEIIDMMESMLGGLQEDVSIVVNGGTINMDLTTFIEDKK